MSNKRLYIVLLMAIFVMLVLSLGGGLWGAERSIGHWTGQLFQSVCHQNPDRSFSFMGAPMAVNSRCFGVFSGLFIGWVFIPLFSRLQDAKNWKIRLLLFAVALQIIDYSGNLFEIWTNTNISRVVFGGTLGLCVSIAISTLFKSSLKTKKWTT